MNILFLCSRNRWRSPTAEKMYNKYKDYHVKSAGTEPSARIRVNAKLVLWADIIFAMEKRHKERLVDRFPEETRNKKIEILNINDDYGYMDKDLIEIIRLSVTPYLP